ncbi:PP2C family protein-serine/threonine phosphatase [bacterium]|nr:PP2C family protein-serine/threonine phosphatase [bacterium]
MSRGTRGTSSQVLSRRLTFKTILLWALAASTAGLAIGLAIQVFSGSEGGVARSLIPMSIVFANVAVFAAVLTVRFVLPKMSGFPVYFRFPLAVITLIAAGVFGSGLAILINPLVVLYQMRNALMIVTVNGVLALTIGAITYNYELLRQQIETVVAERSKLEQEMEIARTIQTQLLPKSFPDPPGWDIYGFSVPARHVGGDCFDVIDMTDGKFAITIGDVAGKGTPAAILMANVQAAVRALAESGVRPKELMRHVNRIAYSYTGDSEFITFFYCVLDTKAGEIRYVNAGHNPPCVLRSNGEKEFLGKGGLIVGIMPDVEYEDAVITLGLGDSLVLFTDGVTEALNPHEEMFGDERLEALLVEHRHLGAHDIEERVYAELKGFVAGAAQADDITMVAVKCYADAAQISDPPREANGGLSAARGVSSGNHLREPAEAADSTEMLIS